MVIRQHYRFRLPFFETLAFISILFLSASCAAPMKTISPAPIGAESFTAPDGSEFGYTAWLPADGSKPEAVILAVHGLGGAASDWRPLGKYFQKRNFAVYGYELRGMGNDPDVERRGDLKDPTQWFEDFGAFALGLQKKYPDTPIFWYGESLGGVISLNMMQRLEALGLEPAGYVLASPIVNVDGKMAFWKEWLLKLALRVLPNKRIRLEELGGEEHADARVVRSTTHLDRMEITPHAISQYSLRLIGHIGDLVRENRKIACELTVPTFVLYSGNDVFTEPKEVENFFDTLPSSIDKQKCYVPDGYHLLLHDQQRKEILEELDCWFHCVIPPKKTVSTK